MKSELDEEFEDFAPPEIVLDKPNRENGYMWCWGIYQPDCNWAELKYGRENSREEAFRAANVALECIIDQRNNEKTYGKYLDF